jgi:hypothetical protein
VILAPPTFGQSQNFLVSGRVVGDRGAGIPNAIVTLYVVPHPGAFEVISPAARTLPNGEFFIDSGHLQPSDKVRLFVEEPVPTGFWSPLNGPPFGKLARSQPFRGFQMILSPKQSKVDVGDIKAGIRYTQVIIDLDNSWAIEDSPSVNEINSSRLTIKDRFGNAVYDGQLPTSALDRASSSLKIAFPKGNWLVQLSFTRQSGTVTSPRRLLRITQRSCMKFALKVKRPMPCF